MKSLLVTIFTLVGALAYADDIALQNPSYGGSGCPQGTVGVALSPDQKALSVAFDSYVAQAGKSTANTIERKSCNLIVPIHIPQGLSVSILKVDYRGYVFAPKGTMAQFNVEYFLKSFNSQSAGPKATKTFTGLYDSDYLLSNELALSGVVWSACGEDVNLRISSSMMARTNIKKDDVLATVDSTDIAAGLVYHFQWRTCH